MEFENIEEFFECVVVSERNGNTAQTKEYVHKMNKEQFKEFIYWCSDGFLDKTRRFFEIRCY